jgi:hypothetical protein
VLRLLVRNVTEESTGRKYSCLRIIAHTTLQRCISTSLVAIFLLFVMPFALINKRSITQEHRGHGG